jgi:hypothetical protein
MEMNLTARLGTFSLLVGFGLFLLFIANILGDSLHFDYLIISLVLIIVGSKLRARGKTISPPARFSTLRKLRQRDRKKSGGKDDNQGEFDNPPPPPNLL